MLTRQTVVRILAIIAFVGFVVLFRALPVVEWLQSMEAWVRDHPTAGAFAYFSLTIIAIVALTPGWIPMTLAGLLFGFFPGLIYALCAATAGAVAALFVGRTILRSWVERRIEGNAKMLALDDALDDQAFTIVALTRVALVIPFNMLNYAYGLTRVSVSAYAAATLVGMFPIVALYVYLGTLAADIDQVLSGGGDAGMRGWLVAAIALIALTVVGVVVRRAVERALDRQTQSKYETASHEIQRKNV